ncbi:MAG: DUF4124 domain-containing protein [Wenzhouxiangellaceae bacterium]|nr:DUF4124 domain-containing protein [Wenzhouxiangellaceae bacterium]
MMTSACKMPTLLALLALLVATMPAAAQIYRCTDGETMVFSDVPCSDTAEVHELSARLSVVTASRDIESIARRNREFVEQRLERIDRRQERIAGRRAAELRALARDDFDDVRYRNVVGHANSFFPARFGHGRFGRKHSEKGRFGRVREEPGIEPGGGRERNPTLRTGPADFSILHR